MPGLPQRTHCGWFGRLQLPSDSKGTELEHRLLVGLSAGDLHAQLHHLVVLLWQSHAGDPPVQGRGLVGSHGHQLGKYIRASDSWIRGVDGEGFDQGGTWEVNIQHSPVRNLHEDPVIPKSHPPTPHLHFQHISGEHGTKSHCSQSPMDSDRSRHCPSSPFTDCSVSSAGTASW